MLTINSHYKKLPGSYLFTEISHRVAEFQAEQPDCALISLGIGDVTRPLAPSVLHAMKQAVSEMGQQETFHGYGPEQGYDFLQHTIAQHDFHARGIDIDESEIFISDGAKSDCGNISDLFGQDNLVAVCDPVYPVYVDSNAMAGRLGTFSEGRWRNLIYMPCTESSGFLPEIPKDVPDLIYLCFPNNPTGAVATRAHLQAWVSFAQRHGSIILFDACYEAYIASPDIPHSIFEIAGAHECAIEFRSFSKTAGFTGVRCGYTVVPKKLMRDGVSLHSMWTRRQSTKFNGVSYIVQRGAEAIYTETGRREIKETISYYMDNARLIRTGLKAAGLTVFGGEHAPYIWAKTPSGLSSWDFFDLLLKRTGIVVTPGAGFGPHGEGYVRLTAFGTAENTKQALTRIQNLSVGAPY